MSRIVRKSKYRHVFCKASKPEHHYLGLRPSDKSWDTNYIAVNPERFSVLWKSAGGGSVCVHELSKKGKHGLDDWTLLSGHQGPVLDMDWNPFNDNLIATVAEDCKLRVWQIPEGGMTQNIDTPVQTLSGHGRKVGTVNFHPTADNIAATSGADYTVKVWDVEQGACKLTVEGHTGLINCVDWNYNGSLMASICKDKKIRVMDPRQQKCVETVGSGLGLRGGRCVFLGRKEKIFSCGFNGYRQYSVWDPRKMATPLIKTVRIDNASGNLMVFYDEDCDILYMSGKGDGNVRYYEIVDDAKIVYYISEYKTSTPTAGCAMMPKRAMNVNANEVCRLYKLHRSTVEPLSFTVPRKSDMFADDIFIDCASTDPALDANAWLGGADANPKTQTMKSGYIKPKKKEFKAVAQKPTGPQTLEEYKSEYDKLKKRVAYLESALTNANVKFTKA